jgi:tripartite-type tricarboxylate transporter receptor subunit TctC
VKSVRELIVLAKSNAGKLNFSRASAGGASHLAAELFMASTGAKMVPIPYKGGGPAVLAVVTGEADLTFASATASAGPLKAGRLKALAVTSEQPSPLFPGIPPLSAVGLPGFDSVLTNGLFSAAGTPQAIVGRISQEVAQIVQRSDTKERFASIGVEAVGSTPDALSALVRDEMARWGKLIRSAGIRSD